MQRKAQILVVPLSPPNAPPRPGGERWVEAPTIDALRESLHRELEREGHRVRAVSFTKEGMIAYVEERA
jgi:hypothetical protein